MALIRTRLLWKPARSNLFFVCLLGTLAWTQPAAADGECRMSGIAYPQSITVCSSGLALTCMNGTWQDNDGQRCNQPTGTLLGPRRPFREKNTEPIPGEYQKQIRPPGGN